MSQQPSQNPQLLEPKLEPGLQQQQPIPVTIYSQPTNQPQQPIQSQPQPQIQAQILSNVNQQQPMMQPPPPQMQYTFPNIQTTHQPQQTIQQPSLVQTSTLPLAPSPQTQPQSQPQQQQDSQQPTAPTLQPPTTTAPSMNQRLQDLVNEVDPDEQLDEDVEEVLLDIADEFIENVVSSACAIAKHRNSTSLEVDDVKLYLERKYKIWIPGFGESKPVQKRFSSEAHKQRMALINKQDNRPGEEANKSKKN